MTTLSRRELLAGGSAALTLGWLAEDVRAQPPRGRPKIAAITTVYHRHSHAQGIVDRFLDGYGWETRHHRPAVDVVSLYVDQVGEHDLSRERADRHRSLKIYSTIREALTLGGKELAVDGVLLIGEHGNYPRNEREQTLYPRYEFFKQIVDVFRTSGRSVPVFNDKHLSWNWTWAREMVETSRKLDFPFMAGSSLPLTWRLPSIDLPWDSPVEEVVCVGDGGIDSYDFHLLEAVQCLVERRHGTETGVRRIQALRGEAVWRALEAGSWDAGGWDARLFEACLCRSILLMQARESFCTLHPTPAEMQQLVPLPVAYRYEYLDGLKATIVLAPGLLGDITVAARIKNQPDPLSLAFYLGAGHDYQPNFFNPLCWQIEQMFLTGRVGTPLNRTLLTTGLTAGGIESLARGSKWVETPHLAVTYTPPRDAVYRRT